LTLVGPGSEVTALPGSPATLSGSVAYLNEGDTVTVDWGDGSVEMLDASSIDTVFDSFAAEHTYAEQGIYEVVVTVADSDGSDTEAVDAVISGIGLGDDGVLQVVGTAGNDKVFSGAFYNKVWVLAKLDGVGWQGKWLKASDVTSLDLTLGAGDDFAKVSKRLHLPATIVAGGGDDVIIGGSGDTTVFGGAGSDILITRGGNDLLNGGEGSDVLSAGGGVDVLDGQDGADILIGGLDADTLLDSSGDDIVIGGTTIYDRNICALRKLIGVWSSDQSFAQRVAAIESGSQSSGVRLEAGVTVFDDGTVDTFGTNELGDHDWFFADVAEETGASTDDVVSEL
ncbi:MAG: PKD domain-containing protein, partial [Rubripirellula sp.]